MKRQLMNKQIDFYILNDDVDRLSFACQLIEKAYRRQHRLFIQCSHEQQAHQLDDKLWLYKVNSFIPHNIQGEGPNQPPPVQLGYSEQANGYNDILINLSLEVPSFHTQFKRVIEIVDTNEDTKQALREHYRYYQSQSYKINSHKIAQTQLPK